MKKKTKGKSSKIGPVFDANGVLRSTKKDMTNAFGEHLGNELKPDLTFTEVQKMQQHCQAFENLPFKELDITKPYPDWFTPHPDGPDEILTHNFTLAQ